VGSVLKFCITGRPAAAVALLCYSGACVDPFRQAVVSIG